MKNYLIILLLAVMQMAAVSCTNKTESFLKFLDEDLSACTDSVRTVQLAQSTVFEEAVSTAEAYAPLINYLIGHRTDEYADTIHSKIYGMFTRFSSKQTELKEYINQLPAKDQDAIMIALTSFLPEEFAKEAVVAGISDTNIAQNMFSDKFPILAGYNNDEQMIDKLSVVMKDYRKELFNKLLEIDRKTYSDSVRAEMVVLSNIYEESSSSMSDYIPVFNWLISCYCEEYTEGIALYIYRMLTKYPSKQSEIDDFLKLLPIKQQNLAVETLVLCILDNLTDKGIDTLTDEDIQSSFEQFPFLSKYESCHYSIECLRRGETAYHADVYDSVEAAADTCGRRK